MHLICAPDCVHCKENIPHKHLCDEEHDLERFTCEYCGEENVDLLHLCPGKIQNLAYYCSGCGRVAVEPDNICNPEPIPEELKERIAKNFENKGIEGPHICRICFQPVNAPGHVCDQQYPLECPGCGEIITQENHMCNEFIEKAHYSCLICGRLGISQYDLCAPLKLV